MEHGENQAKTPDRSMLRHTQLTDSATSLLSCLFVAPEPCLVEAAPADRAELAVCSGVLEVLEAQR